jgi:hypothetical protein
MPGLRIYNYNWATGEYAGEAMADEDPLEPGNWIVPAYATTKALPVLEPGHRAVFDREADDWLQEKIPAPEAPPPVLLDDYVTIGDLFNANR